MERAGVAAHPQEWEFSGYHEIQNPLKKYGMIDHDLLIAFTLVWERGCHGDQPIQDLAKMVIKKFDRKADFF